MAESSDQNTVGHSVIYRKLILQEHITDDDLRELPSNAVFSFRTIFRGIKSQVFGALTGCPCSYEHEYFDHVSNGYVDADKLDQICRSLENGQCEHVVSSNNDQDTVVTKVGTLHVAIAAGNAEMYIKLVLLSIQSQVSGVFGLTNYHIAVFKQNYFFFEQLEMMRISEEFQNVLVFNSKPFVYFEKINPSSMSEFLLDPYMTLLKLSVKKQDLKMIKCLLSSKCYFLFIQSAIEYSIEMGHMATCKILLDHISNNPKSVGERTDAKVSMRRSGSFTYTQDAILNNQDHILHLLVKHQLLSEGIPGLNNLNALDLAMLLGYEQCVKVLQCHMAPSKTPCRNPYSVIIQLTKRSSDLCIGLLHRLADRGLDINSMDISNKSPIMMAVYTTPLVEPCIVQTLLNLGADVNIMDSLGKNALHMLLSLTSHVMHAQEILKIILYQNPSITCSMRPRYSYLALQLDKKWETFTRVPNRISKVKLQIKDHVPIQDSNEASLLHFTIPILWECGYMYLVRNNLLDEEDIRSIPHQLKQFIKKALSHPRSLKLQCRDTLRMHFQGIKIHNFLEISQCPEPIKRYILVSDILMSP